MTSQPATPSRRSRYSRRARMAAGMIVSLHFYYLVTQTQRMATSLFRDDASRYDAPWHPSRPAATTRPALSAGLPRWLRDYFDWHAAVRRAYPGGALLTDPRAPGVLIRACAYKCGGLHDRLGGLGWDLYLANQTRRVLLIHWCIPAPLEEYLVPNEVNWTLPRYAGSNPLLWSNVTEKHILCDRAVGEWPSLFDGYREYTLDEHTFFTMHLDQALDRAIYGNYSTIKVLRLALQGVDRRLDQRLWTRHGEADGLAWTGSFALLFKALFRPSPGLRAELDLADRQLGLAPPADPGEAAPPPFYAVHARLRHPRGHVGLEAVSKRAAGGNPDRYGLSWADGDTRRYALKQASHALWCAADAHLARHVREHRPKYVFFADSEDLVAEVGRTEGAQGVVVREATPGAAAEVLHIDRQQQRAPGSYYNAFLDLFVAARASCIVFGAGNYALLAAKINTRGAQRCLVRHTPDASHPVVLTTDFLDCNARWELTPTRFDENISALPAYVPLRRVAAVNSSLATSGTEAHRGPLPRAEGRR